MDGLASCFLCVLLQLENPTVKLRQSLTHVFVDDLISLIDI